MWRTLSDTAKSIFLIAAGCILSLALLAFGRTVIKEEYTYVSAFAYTSEPNRYEVRNELLLKAMEKIGACSPEDAAEIWANGLKTRSAAEQYAVMSPALKQEYAKQLEESAPMWVTGVSSPWIDTYRTVLVEKPEEKRQIHHLMFTTQSSTGPGPTVTAILTLERQDGYWRIAGIEGGTDLEAYTGYRK